MVFDLGEKKIEIVLEKFNYSPGENIKGKVILKLKNPTRAKQLRVGLRGEKTTEVLRTSGGGTSPHQEKSYIYNFEMPLDNEKDYLEGEYSFEIKVPANLSQNVPLPGGAIGDILKGVQVLAGKDSRITWYVISYLDIPMGFDISEKVQVNIS
jgi:hypothetical protein